MSNSFTFDPYREQVFADSRLASLCLGRCLTRLLWHLQHGWLLADGAFSIPSLEQEQAAHFQRADQVYRTMAAIIQGMAISDRNDLFRIVEGARRTTWDTAFPDGCYEVVADLAVSARENWSSERRDAYCREVVENYVLPQHDALRAKLQLPIEKREADYFLVGERIEEGLCRPDVHQFLRPRGTWEELRESHELTPAERELLALTDYEIGCCVRDGSNGNFLATLSRDPGELAPHDLWLTRLRADWQRAGLPEDHEAIGRLTNAIRRRSLTRSLLRQQIETLFADAWRNCTTATIGPIEVTLDPPQVKVHGIVYSVERDVALVFERLCAAGGSKSFASMQDECSEFQGDRLDRLKKRMPEALRKWLIAGKGQTLRLDLT